MNKFVKGALIFTGGLAGGFVVCGVTAINLAVKSNTFRTAIKDKIADEVATFLYGEKQPRRVGYASYTDVYRRRKRTTELTDIIIETREEAEQVRYCVYDIFETYGLITVADLYELCGIPNSFKDYQIGWKDPNAMNQMCIDRVRFGYQLRLPKPVALE